MYKTFGVIAKTWNAIYLYTLKTKTSLSGYHGNRENRQYRHSNESVHQKLKLFIEIEVIKNTGGHATNSVKRNMLHIMAWHIINLLPDIYMH